MGDSHISLRCAHTVHILGQISPAWTETEVLFSVPHQSHMWQVDSCPLLTNPSRIFSVIRLHSTM